MEIQNLTDYIKYIDRDVENQQKSFDNIKNITHKLPSEKIKELHDQLKDKNDIDLKKFEEYFQYLYKKVLNNSEDYRSNPNKRFYRGVSNLNFKNAPGIYRANLAANKDEYYFFNEMLVRCPNAFKNMKNINKLTYMQHYSCPTRLLDITSNPLVALYFACLTDTKNTNVDGIVHIFAIKNEDLLYVHSDRVRMLSKLVEFKLKEQLKILRLAYLNLVSGKFPQNTAGRYKDTIIERFYHAVKSEAGAFERDIVPLDLLRPIFVQVPKDNQRILKQDGAFIMSGLDISESDSAAKINDLIVDKIIIPASCKQKLLKSLENVGVCQATLFPEADQVADYLKKN